MTAGCVLAMMGFAMYRCAAVRWGGGSAVTRVRVKMRDSSRPLPSSPHALTHLPATPAAAAPPPHTHTHSHGKIQKFRDSAALQPRVISLTASGGQAASGELQPLKLQDSGSGALHRVASNSSAASEKV